MRVPCAAAKEFVNIERWQIAKNSLLSSRSRCSIGLARKLHLEQVGKAQPPVVPFRSKHVAGGGGGGG